MTGFLEVWAFVSAILGFVALVFLAFNVMWLHTTLSDQFVTGNERRSDARDVRWSVYALGAALVWPLILPAALLYGLYKVLVIIKIAFKER